MRFSFFLIGFTSVVAQIVLVRELMEVFSGNEISLGLILAAWLLWTAAGSGLAGRLFSRQAQFTPLVAGLQIAVAGTLPLTVLAVRISRKAFHLLPGELPGPGIALITCVSSLSLFCLLSGWLFAAGVRLFRERSRGLAGTGAASGYVYWLEAGGAAVGGLLASLLLVPRLDSLSISLLLTLLNLAAAACLLLKRTSVRVAAVLVLLAFFAFYIFPILAPRLEQLSEEGAWPGMRLVDARHSKYGHLVLLEAEASYSLYENGLLLAHLPDPQGAEESVHFALAQSLAPRRVLLIGGGLSGGLTEALKHPTLETIDYVELDPALLELVRERLPEAWLRSTADPRVRVHRVDGRLFLKQSAMRYDVIIVNLPDPQTAQINRFYTLEFFREVASRLASKGIFSFQLSAAENYISPDLASFLSCMNKTLALVFPQVFTMPGDVVHFFATDKEGTLIKRPEELILRIQSRGVKTTYAASSLLTYRMSTDRLRDLEERIAAQPDTRINQDFAPVAYYFAVALWSGRFHAGYREVMRILAAVPYVVIFAGLTLILLILSAAVSRVTSADRQLHLAVGCAVAAMGFTLIAMEVLLLLAFQAVYGFMYERLAMLIAALMSGMTLGAWFGLRYGAVSDGGRDVESDRASLCWIQIAAVVWAPLQCLFYFLSASMTHTIVSSIFSHGIYPAMALLTGMLGGYQFILASRVFHTASNPTERSTGLLYALDLAGSCAGALLLSIYLIPVYGFLKTSILISLLNLLPAVSLAMFPRRRG